MSKARAPQRGCGGQNCGGGKLTALTLLRLDLLDAVGETGLWDIVRRFEDHGASTVCTLGAVDLRQGAGAPVQLFRGELRGTVVPPRGDVRHGAKSWNSSFQPDGQTRTFGEVPIDEQAQFSHRHLALKAFAQHMRATMAL